uniref:LigA n=1 Tax=Parastrongyloides trichosuri TaxID=131310 RepID=A0A0N4Z8C7_PARTI
MRDHRSAAGRATAAPCGGGPVRRRSHSRDKGGPRPSGGPQPLHSGRTAWTGCSVRPRSGRATSGRSRCCLPTPASNGPGRCRRCAARRTRPALSRTASSPEPCGHCRRAAYPKAAWSLRRPLKSSRTARKDVSRRGGRARGVRAVPEPRPTGWPSGGPQGDPGRSVRRCLRNSRRSRLRSGAEPRRSWKSACADGHGSEVPALDPIPTRPGPPGRGGFRRECGSFPPSPAPPRRAGRSGPARRSGRARPLRHAVHGYRVPDGSKPPRRPDRPAGPASVRPDGPAGRNRDGWRGADARSDPQRPAGPSGLRRPPRPRRKMSRRPVLRRPRRPCSAGRNRLRRAPQGRPSHAEVAYRPYRPGRCGRRSHSRARRGGGPVAHQGHRLDRGRPLEPAGRLWTGGRAERHRRQRPQLALHPPVAGGDDGAPGRQHPGRQPEHQECGGGHGHGRAAALRHAGLATGRQRLGDGRRQEPVGRDPAGHGPARRRWRGLRRVAGGGADRRGFGLGIVRVVDHARRAHSGPHRLGRDRLRRERHGRRYSRASELRHGGLPEPGRESAGPDRFPGQGHHRRGQRRHRHGRGGADLHRRRGAGQSDRVGAGNADGQPARAVQPSKAHDRRCRDRRPTRAASDASDPRPDGSTVAGNGRLTRPPRPGPERRHGPDSGDGQPLSARVGAGRPTAARTGRGPVEDRRQCVGRLTGERRLCRRPDEDDRLGARGSSAPHGRGDGNRRTGRSGRRRPASGRPAQGGDQGLHRRLRRRFGLLRLSARPVGRCGEDRRRPGARHRHRRPHPHPRRPSGRAVRLAGAGDHRRDDRDGSGGRHPARSGRHPRSGLAVRPRRGRTAHHPECSLDPRTPSGPPRSASTGSSCLRHWGRRRRGAQAPSDAVRSVRAGNGRPRSIQPPHSDSAPAGLQADLSRAWPAPVVAPARPAHAPESGQPRPPEACVRPAAGRGRRIPRRVGPGRRAGSWDRSCWRAPPCLHDRAGPDAPAPSGFRVAPGRRRARPVPGLVQRRPVRRRGARHRDPSRRHAPARPDWTVPRCDPRGATGRGRD